ncbi:MAG: flagellar hook-associated protein FlgL [Burkholderiaceae bacterium]
MTRISSEQVVQQAIRTITDRQDRMGEIQQRIASGQRILKPSDDPVGAAHAEQTRADIVRTQIEERMVNFARLKLAQTENAIGDGVDLFQSAREVLLTANNDTYSDGDRLMFAQQLRGMYGELLSVANRDDGLGAYVFGGAGSRTPPFAETAAGVEFQADAGVQVTGGQYRYITSVDGAALFQTATASGVADNGSVFAALEQAIALLEDPATDPAALHTGMQTTIDTLDRSLDHFNATRALLGEQMAAAERAIDSLANNEIGARERLSDLADTDLAEAISELNRHQSEVQAAMQTYTQISGLSLFNYIR